MRWKLRLWWWTLSTIRGSGFTKQYSLGIATTPSGISPDGVVFCKLIIYCLAITSSYSSLVETILDPPDRCVESYRTLVPAIFDKSTDRSCLLPLEAYSDL
ncbi:hypothetical protein D3C76_1524710 [compost metagenome]